MQSTNLISSKPRARPELAQHNGASADRGHDRMTLPHDDAVGATHPLPPPSPRIPVAPTSSGQAAAIGFWPSCSVSSSSSSSSRSSPRQRASRGPPRSPSAERANPPDFAAGFLQKRRRLMPGSGGIGGGNSGLDGGGGGGCGLPPRIASPLARLTPARHEDVGEEAPAPPASPHRRRAGGPPCHRPPAPPRRQQQQPSGCRFPRCRPRCRRRRWQSPMLTCGHRPSTPSLPSIPLI